VSPDGRSAYAASFAGSAVAVFDRAADGTLTQKPGASGCVSETGAVPCADGKALDHAAAVTVSPDGKSTYVASVSSAAVAVFDREPAPAPAPPPVPPSPSTPTPTPTPFATTSDTFAVRDSALSLSRTRFRAVGRGPNIATNLGARVSYTLSEPAAVRLGVERALSGRRVGGRCVKPVRSNRSAKRCTRYALLRGGATLQGKVGRNTFALNGRAGNRKLRPGRYRLRAIATDPSGNTSLRRSSHFQVVRG
jgi:hypothetical protein